MSYSDEVLADAPWGYWPSDEPAYLVEFTSSSNYPGEEPTKAFDRNVTTYWTTLGTKSGWLRTRASPPVVETSYTIRRRNDIPARMPKDWTFEGSNDGSTWTVLDTRSGVSWTTAGDKTFTFTNSTAYEYFRLNVSMNNGDAYLSVAELALGSGATSSALLDASGNGRHMVVSGVMPTIAQPGPAGEADAVAWPASTNSHGRVANSQQVSGTNGMTIEAWIYLPALPSDNVSVIGQGDNATGAAFNDFGLHIDSQGRPVVYCFTGSFTQLSGQPLALGEWHHVVAVMSTTDGLRLRVNKVTVASNASAKPSTNAFSRALWHHASGYGHTAQALRTSKGAFYANKALTDARIDAHYDAMLAAPVLPVDADFAGTGSLSATAVPRVAVVANFVGSGALSATTSVRYAVDAAFTGSGELSATASSSDALEADFTGSGELTATTGAASPATFAGSGELSATIEGRYAVDAAFTGAGALSAAVFSPDSGLLANFVGSGSLSVVVDTVRVRNQANGRRRSGYARLVATPPVTPVPPGLSRGHRVDKAVALPTPTLVNGRPT